MAPFQTQITQISNGFFVALPPGRIAQQAALENGQQPAPTIQYGADLDEVIEILRANWPSPEVKIVRS